MSPIANWGEALNFSNSKFTKLKSEGDKIQFRLIGPPHYDGKHFLKDDEGNWNVQPCVRINEKSECEYCNKFFQAHAKAKKEGLSKKETNKLTDPYKPSMSFYFPVINRDTGMFEVFQTTKGVRDAIDAELALGTKIMERDLVVLRTEKPGNYYKVSVVDSADTKDLTKEEKLQLEKGKKTNLSNYIAGVKDEDSNLAVEANSEVVEEIDTDEVPF